MKKLALISFIEGISLIVLIFIGMPLKYIWGYKIATGILGSIHGTLWLAFLYVLYITYREYKFDKGFIFKMLFFSVIPFGLIPMEKLIKEFDDKINNKQDEGEFINA
ncbi:DUF3817 domain-containing protein [Persephonella sp.]